MTQRRATPRPRDRRRRSTRPSPPARGGDCRDSEDHREPGPERPEREQRQDAEHDARGTVGPRSGQHPQEQHSGKPESDRRHEKEARGRAVLALGADEVREAAAYERRRDGGRSRGSWATRWSVRTSWWVRTRCCWSCRIPLVLVGGAVDSHGRPSPRDARRPQLRDPDEGVSLAPPPGLARLPELVAQVGDAGLSVSVEVSGVPQPLPTGSTCPATGSCRSR